MMPLLPVIFNLAYSDVIAAAVYRFTERMNLSVIDADMNY